MAHGRFDTTSCVQSWRALSSPKNPVRLPAPEITGSSTSDDQEPAGSASSFGGTELKSSDSGHVESDCTLQFYTRRQLPPSSFESHELPEQQDGNIAMAEIPLLPAPELSNSDTQLVIANPSTPSIPIRFPNLKTRAPLSQLAVYDDDPKDNGSEVDPDTQARQLKARERLAVLRGRVLRMRRARTSYGQSLRQLRGNVRDAAAGLTRTISEMVATGDPVDLRKILPYYEALQQAQDELGPREDEHDRLESRLDDEEQDLEQEEDYFYRHNNILAVEEPDMRLSLEISPLINPYQLPEEGSDDFTLETGVVQQYLKKVAEAEQLKCEVDELEEDYLRYCKESSYRKRHNIPISSDKATFLSTYEEQYETIVHSLYQVEDDLLDLRDECLDQNLFNDCDYVYELRDAFYDDIMDLVDQVRNRYPLHEAASRLKYPQHETKFDDKRDYVNQWMLQWIQYSLPETSKLYDALVSTYANEPEQMTNVEWPELILEHWDTDDAGSLATQMFRASKLDAIAGDGHQFVASTARRTGLSGTLSTLHNYPNWSSLDIDLELQRDSVHEDTSSRNDTAPAIISAQPSDGHSDAEAIVSSGPHTSQEQLLSQHN
jgi:hypothetical protein